MDIDVQSKVDQEDRPLTRADIEQLLHEAGSPNKLNLSGRNLARVNLVGLNLGGADLREAQLEGADLRQAHLRGAELEGADLRQAQLERADLRGAHLRGADLREAQLEEAYLLGADLRGADLRDAQLEGAQLEGAHLDETYYRNYFARAKRVHVKKEETEEDASTLRIRIVEEPLILQNLTTAFSALTELSTKCWLIATGRFAELVEYMQTRLLRSPKEAQFIVTRVRYNSPFDLSVNFANLDPKNLTAALKEGIDTILLGKERLKQAELDTQAKTEQLKQAERKSFQEYLAKKQELEIAAQKAAQESQMGQLEQEKQKFELEKQRLLLQVEQEKQKLELEKQRLDLQRQRLEIENMRMNFAIEAANKIIDLLSPNSDQATREMMIPMLLPNLLQFQSVKGLELALAAPKKEEENTPRAENG
jgi:uncharacterized protein YjbI with pentapeptide repeats